MVSLLGQPGRSAVTSVGRHQRAEREPQESDLEDRIMNSHRLDDGVHDGQNRDARDSPQGGTKMHDG